jgi:hypothetical protein
MVGGFFIGAGIVVAAILLTHAFIANKAGERFINVKGLAEREVDADLAMWPVTFTETDNSLAALQISIDAKRQIVTKFLQEKGFQAGEISQTAPKIRDNQAESYSPKNDNKFRYIAQTTVLLRSNKVGLVKGALEKAGVLVGQGIVLANDWQSRTEFLFTALNVIKPMMIEEATKNARDAAEKFAKDSGSKIGKIRSATQGLFTITDRDSNSPDKKNVRVVTTVEYFLIDE